MLPAIFTLLSLVAADAPPPPPHGAGMTNRPRGLISRTIKLDAQNYTYQVYVPHVEAGQKLPVILFLHGIGQRGENGFVPTEGSARALVESYMSRVPAIIVLPQCRRGSYWWDDDMTRMTLAALDAATEEFGGDRDRVSLIGVSMGGYGAWYMAAEHAGRFAAVVPICGGSTLRGNDRFNSLARRIGRTPVWAFHGADDRVVPVSESRAMVKALESAGGDVRYSEHAGVGHNVWMNALAEPELLPWVLSRRRAVAPTLHKDK